MKFSLSWLKTHLQTQASLEALCERLSMIGLEVDGVEDRAASLAPFTVAYVKEAKPHPDADRLRVCIVDTGKEEVQVVCGAPNARSGMKGVFAAVGLHIPGTDLLLKKGKIRGQDSNGMLVSEREMGLSDEHEGIIDLPDDAPIGVPFAKVLGLDDPVIDVALTPNRGDCLGVRGIARDLAAAGMGSLKPVDLSPMAGQFDSPVRWRRDFDEAYGKACPYVVGRYFRNVKNGPSPKWLQDRLQAIGLRPISALVDMTNFVTYDLGRPLHVFDADKLQGDLVMRQAREGERILALDGREYSLDGEMTVIADEAGIQGIGGIMGGELSGCTEATTNVFLESALFDPVRVAASGRRLGIHSDARYRFERGVDPVSADWGAEVATRLVLELCGGEASHVVSAGAVPDWRREITLRPSRLMSLGGLDLAAEEQRRILTDLSFTTRVEEETIVAAVPSWRPDIEGEACLVEEVLRIHGYDKIPTLALPPASDLPQPALDGRQRRSERVRHALALSGLEEAVTFSFLSSDLARHFGEQPESLRLINPISADLDVMRPSVLPNLLSAAGRNADRGLGDVALFELGPQYHDHTPEGQATVAAGVRAGLARPRHWADGARSVDLFDAKADAIAALQAAGAPVENLQTQADPPPWYHPGRAGSLRLGPKVLAYFGEIHPRILSTLDLRGPAVGFEVFLDAVPQPKTGKSKAKAPLKLSPFQPVERDFAFIVPEDVAAERLVRAAKGADKALVSKVELFDVYAGKGIEAGKKSLAIAVTLQPSDHTLTEAELEQVSSKIVAQVQKATGGVLRG